MTLTPCSSGTTFGAGRGSAGRSTEGRGCTPHDHRDPCTASRARIVDDELCSLQLHQLASLSPAVRSRGRGSCPADDHRTSGTTLQSRTSGTERPALTGKGHEPIEPATTAATSGEPAGQPTAPLNVLEGLFHKPGQPHPIAQARRVHSEGLEVFEHDAVHDARLRRSPLVGHRRHSVLKRSGDAMVTDRRSRHNPSRAAGEIAEIAISGRADRSRCCRWGGRVTPGSPRSVRSSP
jgi:hypothetical protein